MPEITQVQELIAPLRKNPQTILDERDDNQETTNGGEITRINNKNNISTQDSVTSHG